MPNSKELSAAEAIGLLLRDRASFTCLDVRSEGEFSQGAVPGAVNIPILTNEERHRVGLSYKEEGPDKAIELGHDLVRDHRDELIRKWMQLLRGAKNPLVHCWRGGMRSQLSVDWIRESGAEAIKVLGGYKAMRKELLSPLEKLPSLMVISGPTGSNKSGLLRTARSHLDLELLANHRGSAFGQYVTPQPTQASFENQVGLSLLSQSLQRVFVEDESMMIGHIHLPPPLRAAMNESPVLLIRTSVEERVENIFREYIEEAIAKGQPPSELQSLYQQSIQRIAKKLGGLLTQQILAHMNLAFTSDSRELHFEWIRDLLVNYYDNAYAFSFARANRKIAFEGDWNECKQWIQKFA